MAGRSLRVQVQELGGRIARLLRGFALRLLPLVRAEPVQRRVLGRRAAVARHEMQAQHGHVELVAAGVLEQQELRRHAFDVERREPAVAPDAVVLVHDGCADLQVGELANDGLGVARAALALALSRPLHAEVRGRDHAQPALREAEAVVNLRDRDSERRVAREELLPARIDVRLRSRGRAGARAAFRGGPATTSRAACARPSSAPSQRSMRSSVAAMPPASGCVDAGVLVARERGVRRQRQRRSLGDARAQLCGAEERLRRLQDRPLDVAVQLLVALVDELPRGLERVERAVDDDEQRVRAQVVEQRCRLAEEQRQVVLDAGRELRVGDRAVDGAAPGLDGKMLAKALAKELDRGLVERKLARGQDFDLVGLARRELRLRVERAQRFDLVVEQVDADRRRAAGREHVEHGAANRELAGLRDLFDAQIAVLAQAFRHLAWGRTGRLSRDTASERR